MYFYFQAIQRKQTFHFTPDAISHGLWSTDIMNLYIYTTCITVISKMEYHVKRVRKLGIEGIG